MPAINKSRSWLLLALFMVLALAAFSLAASGKAQEQKNPPAKTSGTSTAPAEETSTYAGSDACKTCHEDEYRSWEQTSLWKMTLKTKDHVAGGCETCHGPGQAHIEGGGDKTKIFGYSGVSSKEASARCLECHTYDEEHGNFARAAHLQNNVGCTTCHSMHHPGGRENLMKLKQPQICYTCHLEIKQQFERPFHHRVNEGLVQCTDCHNPHGGFLSRQLRATSAQDNVCFKCHTEKAGPFVFEHPVIKVEGCVACHVPHGSSNARLLKRSQVNLLCLECHAFTTDVGPLATPTFHNQAQKYQACTLCHTAIHGSNVDRFFFK